MIERLMKVFVPDFGEAPSQPSQPFLRGNLL
jgi:hypothetical protein